MASPSPAPAATALVDLVCGPASPLPETYQRYRLVARLGSGGQADVYRGVRLCGGVTSAPITVKVFRIDPNRPLADELRSWDKGDAALMDLNNRGVGGICRRADGFYGPPPHPAGSTASVRDAVPYQIYDYLHGINLREYIVSRAGFAGGPRLSAAVALTTLADTLKALHHPNEPGACPVLHMDIKPSNIMALTNGAVSLIDFTGARYWRREEITQIAYTPESGGPEALRGEVSPSYDVHGFGAVAFFLLAGVPPRGHSAPPMAQHALFDGRPALRDHVLAPLADDPVDRPSTTELAAWVDRLMTLVRASSVPDLGLDWSEPKPAAPAVLGDTTGRAVGRAKPVLAGTETDAFSRIEMLERELVSLRANSSPTAPEAPQGLMQLPVPDPIPSSPNGVQANPTVISGPTVISAPPTAATQISNQQGVLPSMVKSPPPVKLDPTKISAPPNQAVSSPPNGSARQASGNPMMVGRAAVVARPPEGNLAGGYGQDMPPPRPRAPRNPGENLRRLKRGGTWSVVGVSFSLICWIIWAASNRARGVYVAPAFYLGTLVVAFGLFLLLRLLGRLILEGWMNRTRRGATGAHLGVAVFLVAVGITYLEQTTWIAKLFGLTKGMMQ